jgi:hypothetical protein
MPDGRVIQGCAMDEPLQQISPLPDAQWPRLESQIGPPTFNDQIRGSTRSPSHYASSVSTNMALTLVSRRAATRAVASCSAARSFSTPVHDTTFSPAATPPPPPTAESQVLRNAVNATTPRYDWTRDEIREIYQTPLMDLAFQSVLQPNHSTVTITPADIEPSPPSTAASTAPRPSRCAPS